MPSTSVRLKFLFILHPRTLTPMLCFKIHAFIMSSLCLAEWGAMQRQANLGGQQVRAEASQGNESHQLETGLATQQDRNILNSNRVGRKQPEWPIITSPKEADHKLLWRVCFSYTIYLPCQIFLLLLIKMQFVGYVMCMCNRRDLSHWSP